MEEAFVAKLEMITQYFFLNRLKKTEEIRYPVQVSKGVLLEDVGPASFALPQEVVRDMRSGDRAGLLR